MQKNAISQVFSVAQSEEETNAQAIMMPWQVRCGSKTRKAKRTFLREEVEWWIKAFRRRFATTAQSHSAPKSMAVVRHSDSAPTTAGWHGTRPSVSQRARWCQKILSLGPTPHRETHQ
jgi:hypothetical protein